MSNNNVKNFFVQVSSSGPIDDNILVIGGTQNVISGGELNVLVGATLNITGTQNITGMLNAAAASFVGDVVIDAAGSFRSRGDFTGDGGTVAAFVIDATDLAEALTLVNALKAIAIDIGAMDAA